MDAGKVSLQIISHAPGLVGVDNCVAANDQLAAAVKQNPERFKGFAVLPVSDPQACAAELRRCVDELGFVGALIDNHTADGVYYDGSEYDVLWAEAEKLGVPIYLHPTWPTDAIKGDLYSGNFEEGAAVSMGSSGWGWHSDVAVHVLRLFASGVFDRFPGVKVVIGHFGEMIPFMLERLEVLSRRWGRRERDIRTVWDSNVWVTTSGVWSVNPMRTLLANTKVERVLYSVDYPFAQNEVGLEWWEELEKSGLCTEKELEMIAHGNAEALLGVKATKTFD